MTTKTWTVLQTLQWTSEWFGRRSLDSPRLTAELLLAHVLKLERVRLYMEFDRPLTAAELAAFRALIERRVAGESTAYLLGYRHFYGRRFEVDARVLVPRPETELLVDLVGKALSGGAAEGAVATAEPREVLDLCTGSGCIALSLAAEWTHLRLTGTDLSPRALEVATANRAALGLNERVELLQGDLFAPVAGRRFHALVSNPPYVAEGQMAGLPAEVKAEPRLALAAGEQGMDVLARLVQQAPAHLHPGGLLAVEMGEEQGAMVSAAFAAAGFIDVVVTRDWAGHDRVVAGRLPPGA